MRWLIVIAGLLAIGAMPAPRTIAPNTFVDWKFNDGPRTFRAGNVTVRMSAKDKDSPPVMMVSAPGVTPLKVVIKDSGASSTSSVGIGAIRRGQPRAVILQSWTGGAHCCFHIVVVEQAGRGFRTVDFGDWDGDQIPWPRDRDGDGVADLVLKDQSFLYAFGCYACGWPPPQVMTIRDGKAVDVSTKPAFRPLFAADMATTRTACIDGGDSKWGACTAFLADAARVGQFDAAWRQLKRARIGWDGRLAAGCARNLKLERCGDDFASTVRAFLRKHGYLK
jgi:hypothetical protein